MPQLQSQWSSLLTPVIMHFFDLGVSNVPSLRNLLLNVQSSDLSQEEGTGVGAMGHEAWDEYQNSGKPGELDFDQGYTKTYTPVEYPVRFRVEKRLLLNEQYGVMNRNSQRIGVSAEQKMERDAASLLNNAFNAAFVGGDLVSLCNASHPASPAKSAVVQSNTGTSVLSKSAVSATRIAMMRFDDDKGQEIGVMPNELWVPPELEDKALEIVGSALDPDSANNAINPQAGRWSVVPWMRLTGTKAWFMTSSVQRQMLANWYNREAFQLMLIEETTTHIVWEAKLHYSFGWDDWRWVFGHNPPTS